jgi:hypothetical protein
MDSGSPIEKHASRPHPGSESASFAASRIDGPSAPLDPPRDTAPAEVTNIL